MIARNAGSRFATNPTNIEISRSKFERNSTVTTSFLGGLLIPFYLDEVLPGDTFKIRCSKVVRMPALITPLMGNLYLDTFWFFVPNRLVWSHWKEFMGENSQSAWIPQAQYSIPQTTAPASSSAAPSGGWTVGSIADYLGIPPLIPNISVSSLPLRGYALIWNEFFRSENLQDPVPVSTGDANTAGANSSPSSQAAYLLSAYSRGGYPAPVDKFFDYFTACLPAPQKGNDVVISVTSGGLLPVFAMDQDIDLSSLPERTTGIRYYTGTAAGQSSPVSNNPYDLTYNIASYGSDAASYPGSASKIIKDGQSLSSGDFPVFPANLFAGDSGALTVASVNQLRTAFQLQKLLEKDARGGTRYIEMLKSHFSVTSPDYRLQRPEYLGGSRIPIRVSQVIQQSETATTPQGNVSGMSLTTDSNDGFTKSFTEHGYIFGLLCVRYLHLYQQGLDRMWSRKNRLEFYFPVLANIGEQAVLNKEIFIQGTSVVDSDGNVVDEQVFGYNEAWADYRYKPSKITGMMRSVYVQSLDSWHLGDYYSQLPSLSADWIKEDATIIDRVLSAGSSLTHQFIADIYVENTCVRVMPLYSIPGLIDHH